MTAPSPVLPPEIAFPDHLPVSGRRDDIAAALQAHQVVIVCGETGSGKTTQLPKIAFSAGRGRAGLIGMTQPRRIAAKSVASRLAEETRTRLGGFIGWQVRFTDQAGAETRIKVMTDGILLAETQSDPEFRAYDTLILDEAHERSLNIDFLLGYLKNLLPRRPDLRLILSSATLEAERFSRYFDGAPVVEVSGRTYPVEMRWRPVGEAGRGPADQAETTDAGLGQAILAAVDELAAEGPGDVLVFLPGEREIREAQEALRKHHPAHTEILPLYARLSVSEQEKVFQPHGGRRIVLATNVAETSLTVPGIRYVVDTGLARVKRYSLRNKIEQLKVEKIAQASANQRAGRCGRVAAGICIRLYDEPDFQSRPAYTTPELLRSSLAGVILRMKSLHLPEIDVFPFPDPPESKRVRDGQQLLAELNALDERGELTAVGRQLARLPVDPRIGRMLIAARERGCLGEVLAIAAFLSCQDPRERPLEQQATADEKHRRFADEHSDFVAIVKLWRHIDEMNTHRKSQRKFRDALKAEFLSPLRVREWRDVHGQLATLVKELGWRCNEQPADHATLHQALLPGLLGNLGMLTENEVSAQAHAGDASVRPRSGGRSQDGSYLGARGMKFALFPASGVKKKPKWVMAAEIVETRRIYARTVARVEPEWIEHAARHLLKISYADPHWAKKPAHVAAAMRATLYGLPVVNGRMVHYGPIDPEGCREIFIRHALVQGEYDSRAPWFQHNRRLLEEIDDLAQRARDVRLGVDEQALYDYFDARVPAGIHNGAALEKWLRDTDKSVSRQFFLDRETLLAGRRDATGGFPPELELAGVRYPLAYRFDPGTEDDGVTLTIPLAALNQLPAARCEWLVPGLLEEKLAALLKSLPQSVRRAFVPIGEYARAAAGSLTAGDAPLLPALATFLKKTTGIEVPHDAWRPENLPAHLHMHFRILDDSGKVLGQGRDLAALRRALGGAASREMEKSAGAWQRDNLEGWDLGDLPGQVAVAAGKRQVGAFPALEETAEGGVRLRLFDSLPAARTAHRRGVCRLIWLGHSALLKQCEKDLAASMKTACLHLALLSPGSRCSDLVRDVLAAACSGALKGDAADIRGEAAYTAAATATRPLLADAVRRTGKLAADCILRAHALHQALARAPATWKEAVLDMQAQLAGLIQPGFIAATPATRLARLPHYLQAMSLRLDKLAKSPARDAQAMREMAPLLQAFRHRQAQQPDAAGSAMLEDFRWRLEELRIALFAQEVKTPEPVSVKRLEKRWQEIDRAPH